LISINVPLQTLFMLLGVSETKRHARFQMYRHRNTNRCNGPEMTRVIRVGFLVLFAFLLTLAPVLDGPHAAGTVTAIGISHMVDGPQESESDGPISSAKHCHVVLTCTVLAVLTNEPMRTLNEVSASRTVWILIAAHGRSVPPAFHPPNGRESI